MPNNILTMTNDFLLRTTVRPHQNTLFFSQHKTHDTCIKRLLFLLGIMLTKNSEK